MVKLPFEQFSGDGFFVRKFSPNVDDSELSWHCDNEDRLIVVINESGWLFQNENEVPFELKRGMCFNIKRGHWHRVVRGLNDLRLVIFIR